MGQRLTTFVNQLQADLDAFEIWWEEQREDAGRRGAYLYPLTQDAVEDWEREFKKWRGTRHQKRTSAKPSPS